MRPGQACGCFRPRHMRERGIDLADLLIGGLQGFDHAAGNSSMTSSMILLLVRLTGVRAGLWCCRSRSRRLSSRDRAVLGQRGNRRRKVNPAQTPIALGVLLGHCSWLLFARRREIAGNTIPQQFQRRHDQQSVAGPIELTLVQPSVRPPTQPHAAGNREQAEPPSVSSHCPPVSPAAATAPPWSRCRR